MSDSKKKTSPEEIQTLLKPTGLTLTQEQFEAACTGFDSFEALVRRVRDGVKEADEPASAFKVPK